MPEREYPPENPMETTVWLMWPDNVHPVINTLIQHGFTKAQDGSEIDKRFDCKFDVYEDTNGYYLAISKKRDEESGEFTVNAESFHF